MKVMCIKDDWNPKDGSEPIFGEIVTASQSTIYSGAYSIFEYLLDKNGKSQHFIKEGFIPLSDIDETELIRERKTETA